MDRLESKLEDSETSEKSTGSSQRGRPSSSIIDQEKGTLKRKAVRVVDKARDKKGKREGLSTSEVAGIVDKSDPTARKMMYQLEEKVTDIKVRDTKNGLRLVSTL